MKPALRTVLDVALAVAALSVAARVSVPVPGTPVPQSLQTLAVVLVGAYLGPGRGATALAVYVVVGALGAPVFADGARGVQHLTGPTAGYLVGFVLGAAVTGWAVQWGGGPRDPGPGRAFARGLVGALLGHAVILGVGWLRLAVLVGGGEAYANGVAPFVLGGVAKAVAAAALLALLPRAPRSS